MGSFLDFDMIFCKREIFKEVAGALEDVEAAVAAVSYQALEE